MCIIIYMNKILFALSVLLVLVLGFAIHYDVNTTFQKETIEEAEEPVSKTTFVKGFVILGVGNSTVNAELAISEEEHMLGLSGREVLEEGDGMLFVYNEPGLYTFWMPDMNFALDIIWIDEDFNIVYIKENASPEDFPEKYTPTKPAIYVLEVPSGYVKEHGVMVGSKIEIK